MFRACLITLLALVPLWTSAASAQDTLGAAAPFVNAETVAIVRVDIRKLDVEAALKTASALLSSEVRPPVELGEIRKAFLENGVTEAYAIVRNLNLARPDESFFVVFPVATGKDPQKVIDALSKAAGPPPHELPVIGNAIILAPPDSIDAVKAIKSSPRADLSKALAASKGSTAQIAVALSADMRRVLAETLDKLPEELGGGSGKDLANGLQWLSIGVDAPPKLSINARLQAKDAKSAKQVQTTLSAAVDMLLKNQDASAAFPPLKAVLPLLIPEQENDQLVLTINEENGKAGKLTDGLIKPALVGAREAASRAVSTNNLKQIALGLHNYHDVYSHFPARFGSKKDGTKLLSWRVYILPYLDNDHLYRQFKLDEPWDSEHNKALISKMPKVYASPALPEELAKKGMTSYVTPVGERTVFEGAESTRLSGITDGTSNTIAVLECDAKHAVLWTKPDDLTIVWEAPLKGLTGVWKSGDRSVFLTCFCDGSVRAISDKIEPGLLKKLFQKDDGQVIEEIP